ncbi:MULTISPECIES: hypothetical protein [Bacillaceae]|uniref:hypothetical protein n=1 Tax=Bacillaceae TaxID=186817 RepID=UPI002FFFC267
MTWSKEADINTIDRIVFAKQLTTLAQFYNQKADVMEQSNLLTISIPAELEKHQHLLTIFNQTYQLLEKLKENKNEG